MLLLAGLASSGCGRDTPARPAGSSQPEQQADGALPAAPDALPAEKTGGFDSAKAYAHVARIVSFGPRAPGSEGSRKAQEYFKQQFASFGCDVEAMPFNASTPQGRIQMTNIVGKVAGASTDIVMLMSHYDTKQVPEAPEFVGANDGGSSSGVMLELARLLCARKDKLKLSVWIVLTDGEESYGEWSDIDGTYGSRELAARMSLSGNLKRVKALLLADIVGAKDLEFKREEDSTDWLVDLVWATAKRLGYGSHFLDESTAMSDDHVPFIRRGVPAIDLIHASYVGIPPWHSREDTLEKISARSLGITGHVILETVVALEKKFR
ncbi:MAG: M28 family peptidase [Candidatus Acidiferrales bacterium]